MAGMAAIASPGEFKVKDTDPEAIAASFDRYIRRMDAFFVVSRSRAQDGTLIDIDSDTKKGLLRMQSSSRRVARNLEKNVWQRMSVLRMLSRQVLR